MLGPVLVHKAIEDTVCYCLGASSLPDAVLQGKQLVAVAAAKRHTVVLTASGDVYTWGHRAVTPRRLQLAGGNLCTATAAAIDCPLAEANQGLGRACCKPQHSRSRPLLIGADPVI